VTDLRATFVVARRELLERIRSKWFVIMTLIGPIGMIAMIVVPGLIARSSTSGTRIDIVDQSNTLAPPIEKALTVFGWKVEVMPLDTPDALELEKIKKDKINGFIRIPKDAIDGGEIVYRGDNASSQMAQAILGGVVKDAVRLQRGLRAGIKEDTLATLFAPANFTSKHTTGETEGTSGIAAALIANILAFVLYMVIVLYGVAVMRSVVTEKTSRVMEMLVAAVKPRALMAGKILGVGGAGLIQITVWLGMGAFTLAYRDTILGWFGVPGTGGSALPPFELAEIVVVLLYFVLGFFFYSAMYAAVGAMVSSEQDTQQVQLPVTMLLVIGIVCLQVVSNAPRGSSAAIMSNVPFWSPILMPMRYMLGGASLVEVAISLAILVVSTILVVRAAAKIYRVGVLMYGKRPGVRELIRWLRY
jgi:ABC-2 type transport system permease protein